MILKIIIGILTGLSMVVIPLWLAIRADSKDNAANDLEHPIVREQDDFNIYL